MLTFPNAKLNVGLYVTARRPDGYHTVESAFVPLPWCDALEIVPAPAGQPTSVALTGIPIPGDPATNLCLKAYELLRADFPALPPIQLHLHKIVPIGAGLGGGSADAAFALKTINQLFGLALTPRTTCWKATPAAWGPTAPSSSATSRCWPWKKATCSSPLI
jgi:4-diphosphocytidyl-2-C-methyl-D-erythritol kinase